MAAILTFEQVSKIYQTSGSGSKYALRDVSFSVPDGQKVLEELRAKTGRTAAWTTAIGLASICRAIAKDTGEMIPCSTVLNGEYGCHGLSMSVPVILGHGGIHEILEWKLLPDEHEELKHSIDILRPAMHYVEQFLDSS